MLNFLIQFNFELIHYKSYGHPFYQHELAHVRKKVKNIDTIFICPAYYPYKDVIEFIQTDFLVILIPRIIFKIIIKLGLIRQNLVIKHETDYSQYLNQVSSSNAYNIYAKQKSSASDIIICERLNPLNRSSHKREELSYQASVRDFDRKSCTEIVSIADNMSLSVTYSDNLSDKSTIEQISESSVYFGTNCGPYVCAQSLRKPCFLINVIPFFGTNSYHKSVDYHVPALLFYKNAKEYISLRSILESKLFMLDENQLSQLDIGVEALPWWLINSCWLEFLQKYNQSNFFHQTTYSYLFKTLYQIIAIQVQFHFGRHLSLCI